MERTTLVTGGAGFIGSHLVDRLVALGETVTIIDDLSSGKHENLNPRADLVVADINDHIALDDAIKGVTSVFHLAARVSVQDCIQNWTDGTRSNLLGSISVFDAARRHGLPPVVYASSAAVYGDRSGEVCREDNVPVPISPYGADKLGAEHHARAMFSIHQLSSVGLRFFNVYGPRQDPRSPYAGVISRFCANRMADQPHTVFGGGGQTRDFIFVDDVVNGLLAARARAETRPGAPIFNLCTGHAHDLLELTRKIDLVAGRGASAVHHAAARSGDIRSSIGCPHNAERDLNFSAQTSLDAGLANLWESLRRNQTP